MSKKAARFQGEPSGFCYQPKWELKTDRDRLIESDTHYGTLY